MDTMAIILLVLTYRAVYNGGTGKRHFTSRPTPTLTHGNCPGPPVQTPVQMLTLFEVPVVVPPPVVLVRSKYIRIGLHSMTLTPLTCDAKTGSTVVVLLKKLQNLYVFPVNVTPLPDSDRLINYERSGSTFWPVPSRSSGCAHRQWLWWEHVIWGSLYIGNCLAPGGVVILFCPIVS